MVRLLLLLLVPALLPLQAGAARQGEPVRLEVLEPRSGSQIGGSEVQFRLSVGGSDLPVADGRWIGDGHFAVRLDGVEVLQVRELSFSLIGISPGRHTVEVQLQGWSGGSSNTARAELEVVQVERPDDPRWLMANVVLVVVALIFGGLLLLWLFWVRPQRIEPVYFDDEQSNREGPQDGKVLERRIEG